MESFLRNLIQDLNLTHINKKDLQVVYEIYFSLFQAQSLGNLAVDLEKSPNIPIAWEKLESLKIPGIILKKIQNQKLIFLEKTYSLKLELENLLKSQIEDTQESIHNSDSIKAILSELELEIQIQKPNFALNDGQIESIISSIIHPFQIISGGPGTGKTTVVAFLLKILERLGELPQNDKIALLAPTGRAAQRLTESIQENLSLFKNHSNSSISNLDTSHLRGKTLHDLLSFNPNTNQFYYNKERYLPHRLIIVDETSMVDLKMMVALMNALPPRDQKFKFILIGDPNQLPSVEKGSVILDFMESLKRKNSFVSELKISNRQISNNQGKKSKILTVAEDIIDLKKSNLDSKLPDSLKKESFSIVESINLNSTEKEEIVWLDIPSSNNSIKRDILLRLLWENIFLKQIESITEWRINSNSDLKSKELLQKYFMELNRFRCLTIFRKGYHGVDQLNHQIESFAKKDLYPKKGSITKFDWTIKRKKLANKLYYTGLPILITENDRNRKLFNGDIGLVLPIGKENSVELRAVFAIDNQLSSFALDTLPSHEDAYFLTVHKSQGSEYEKLLMYLPPIDNEEDKTNNNQLLNSQILYTGITRAKKQVYLFGESESWQMALLNSMTRLSGFEI
jgi:exodeoxyribonuclease V alpha subunit